MLDDEEYSSDTSDDDYVPTGADDGDSSVNESGEEEVESEESEPEEEGKGKKGKGKKKRAKKKQAKVDEAEDTAKEATTTKLDDKRIESLWASFKDTAAAPAKKDEAKSSEQSTSSESPINPVTASKEEKSPALTKPVPATSSAAALAAPAASAVAAVAPPPPKRPAPVRSGGLADLASRLSGKKPKLSTLEKSKQDWDSFKSAEGIAEELKTFNQGKMGYLERQAFLERADVKQFEIEKSFRLGRKPQ